MSDIERQEAIATESGSTDQAPECEDISIDCIDCSKAFIWSAGEQVFFRNKELTNPPKRCKPCKRAKNRRLEAIENAKNSGKRHRIEVRTDCADCGAATTVPFYPCQGRPVYCRKCYLKTDSQKAAGVTA